MYPNKLYVIICIAFTLFACGNLNVFEKNETIKGSEWLSNSIVRFEYAANDTALEKNILVNIRHTGLYKYNNIFLFITTIAPNGKTMVDTSEFTIADNSGKWLGSGIGDMFDTQLVFKKNVRFSQVGKYIFLIQHGMRDEKLKEVSDVGLRIENSNQ
jgi:gliding motility-associated lipoprotein GldH